MGPNWSKLVQNGPNSSNKDNYKDQVAMVLISGLFLAFYCMPKSAKTWQKVNSKKSTKKECKKKVKTSNRLPENAGK